MKPIEDYTIGELEALLKQKKTTVPTMITPPEVDINPLRNMVACHMKEIAAGQCNDDMNQYIFECVLKTFYGKDIFTWYNQAQSGC